MSSKAIKATNPSQEVFINNVTKSTQLQRVISSQYDVENTTERSKRGRKSPLTAKVKAEFIQMLKDGYPFPYVLDNFNISKDSWRKYEERARNGRNKALTEFFREIHDLKHSEFKKSYQKVVSSEDWKAHWKICEVYAPKVFAPQPKPSYNPQPAQHLHLHFRDGEIARKFSSLLARGATQEEF